MYRTIEDFVNDWNYESEATLKMLRVLTDASLHQKVIPEGRSLGFLAWHVVLTLGEMGEKMGLAITSPSEDTPAPIMASIIADTYATAASSVGIQVAGHWTDLSLAEDVEMYGEQWKRGNALASLVRHQIHHRAQMTILMRQAGLKVPGVYGPSREEWSQYGMQPMQ